MGHLSSVFSDVKIRVHGLAPIKLVCWWLDLDGDGVRAVKRTLIKMTSYIKQLVWLTCIIRERLMGHFKTKMNRMIAPRTKGRATSKAKLVYTSIPAHQTEQMPISPLKPYRSLFTTRAMHTLLVSELASYLQESASQLMNRLHGKLFVWCTRPGSLYCENIRWKRRRSELWLRVSLL
jgi:hypothetical protein